MTSGNATSVTTIRSGQEYALVDHKYNCLFILYFKTGWMGT